MSQMHAIAAWSSPRIQEERFSLLISIKYFIKLPDIGDYLVGQREGRIDKRAYGRRTSPVEEIHGADGQ